MGNLRRAPQTCHRSPERLLCASVLSFLILLCIGSTDVGAGGIGYSEWASYDAGEIGLRLHHPQGWDATFDEDAVVLDNARSAGKDACVVLIALFERDSKLEPLALMEMMADEMSNLGEPFSDIEIGEIEEDVAGFGHPASSVVVNYTRDGSERTERIFAVSVEDRLYAVLALGPRRLVADRMTDDMWGILRSIEFD